MKKIMLLAFVFLPCLVFSHPPSDIVISYDLLKSEVSVVIEHSVKNPKEHYIYEIEVFVNDKKVIRQDTTAQINNKEQSLLYIIPGLKNGDKITVWAECNKGGEIKKSLVLKEKDVK